MLPDLVDKPLGALLGLESRLWAHTFLFLAVLALASRTRPLRGLTWIAFGVAVHLTLDMIWFEPNIALWPLFGLGFPPGTQSLGGYLEILLTDRYVELGEGLGTVLLIVFARAHGLLSWKALREFARTGIVRPAA